MLRSVGSSLEQCWAPGCRLNIEMLSYQNKDPNVKIRWSCDRLISNMGIPIPGKDGISIEMGPW